MILPRKSWTLPPVHYEKRQPSLWRIHQSLRKAILQAVLGILTTRDLIEDTDRMMRRLMEPPRSRTARGIAIIQSSRLT